ncbi:hypothetical protein [Halorussus pelagicus]|uniref:hypothetical protein n=1 Tax=Halorussus pelagicus TaxID=2505977 RepID=UPI000FFBF7B1|nr:hypothetical protein [Halorussus pelagicus]
MPDDRPVGRTRETAPCQRDERDGPEVVVGRDGVRQDARRDQRQRKGQRERRERGPANQLLRGRRRSFSGATGDRKRNRRERPLKTSLPVGR